VKDEGRARKETRGVLQIGKSGGEMGRGEMCKDPNRSSRLPMKGWSLLRGTQEDTIPLLRSGLGMTDAPPNRWNTVFKGTTLLK